MVVFVFFSFIEEFSIFYFDFGSGVFVGVGESRVFVIFRVGRCLRGLFFLGGRFFFVLLFFRIG